MITKNQNSVFLAFLFILMAGIMSCKENVPMDLAQESIIPKPVSIMATNSSFELDERLSIYVKGEAQELNQIGEYLANIIKPSTGFGIEVQSTDKEPGAGNIYLTISDSDTELGEEGYELSVTENLISLNADKPAGLIRGIQTLRQILPPKTCLPPLTLHVLVFSTLTSHGFVVTPRRVRCRA